MKKKIPFEVLNFFKNILNIQKFNLKNTDILVCVGHIKKHVIVKN